MRLILLVCVSVSGQSHLRFGRLFAVLPWYFLFSPAFPVVAVVVIFSFLTVWSRNYMEKQGSIEFILWELFARGVGFAYVAFVRWKCFAS